MLLPYDLSKEDLIRFTSKWQGPRFSDGRPMVDKKTLAMLREYVSITFAWQICNQLEYKWQFLGGFQCTRPGEMLVGRALTALYAPVRPDLKEVLMKSGHESGQIGDMISWPIDALTEDDVYVADVFGKLEQGPVVGERLSASVYAHSHCGAVHNAAVRDIDGIREIEGFNIFHRGMHPSYASPTIMLLGINCPMRMEQVTVMPGDVVMAKDDCVFFLPPHLAEFTALSGAIEHFRDLFGIQRLTQRRYTPGQIDAAWTNGIEEDFKEWLAGQPGIPFKWEDLDKVKDIRTW